MNTTAIPTPVNPRVKSPYYSDSETPKDLSIPDPFIQIQGITKSFDGFVAVDDVNLDIYQGEIFALLGGSGCGKSTLLRMLSGFEMPTDGKILIDGEDMSGISPYRRPTNMMFQSYALFPHMTVEKNIAYGLEQEKLPKAEIAQRVDEMLALVHMEQFRKRKPDQLSGGQRQRVALARSLAKKPKALLLDEPMGALDKKLRTQMQLELVDIIKQVGVTCVMVTHDQEEAMTMADRVAVMNKGWLVQIGTPREVYEFPNCRFTAEFIGSVNVFKGRVTEEFPDHAMIRSKAMDVPLYIDHGITGPAQQKLEVAIRPEKMTLTTEKPDAQYNWCGGKVVEIAYLGGHSVYHIELGNGKQIQAQRSNQIRFANEFQLGTQVYLSWPAQSNVVLGTEL